MEDNSDNIYREILQDVLKFCKVCTISSDPVEHRDILRIYKPKEEVHGRDKIVRIYKQMPKPKDDNDEGERTVPEPKGEEQGVEKDIPEPSKDSTARNSNSALNFFQEMIAGESLEAADFAGAELEGVDLHGKNFKGASFEKANLKNADLHQANLSNCNLMDTDLRGANLIEANLVEAKLCRANLRGAKMAKAAIERADLSNADLRSTDLSNANLRETNLYEANFRGADLSEVNLVDAIANKADLVKANLVMADLIRTDLHEAKLQGANLTGTRLIHAILSHANITGVTLYGTSRDDWSIDEIYCDFVFWDREKKVRTPKDRSFKLKEFEDLYKHLPTFEYFFEHGFTIFDAVLMGHVVQDINEKHSEYQLMLDSFHSRGQPHAQFTVLHEEYVEEARRAVTKEYEARMKSVEGQVENIHNFLSMLATEPKTLINHITLEKGELTMGDKHVGRDNIEISQNAQVTGFTTGTGDTFHGDYAQKMLQSASPQSSREEIENLLSFVQQELHKLPLPEEVKEEVIHELKGAEIQVKKEQPDKRKLADKLKNATEALKESAGTIKEAIVMGNLLGKAIQWCGEQWIIWTV